MVSPVVTHVVFVILTRHMWHYAVWGYKETGNKRKPNGCPQGYR